MAVDPLALAVNDTGGTGDTGTTPPSTQDTELFNEALGNAIITGGIMIGGNIISKMQADMQEKAAELQEE